MRQLGQAETIFDILVLVDNSYNATIVGLEKLTKYKDGKYLSLCEIVSATNI